MLSMAHSRNSFFLLWKEWEENPKYYSRVSQSHSLIPECPDALLIYAVTINSLKKDFDAKLWLIKSSTSQDLLLNEE